MEGKSEAFFVCDIHNSILGIEVLLRVLPILQKNGYGTLLIESSNVYGEEEKYNIEFAKKCLSKEQELGNAGTLVELATAGVKATPENIKPKILKIAGLRPKSEDEVDILISYIYQAVRRQEYYTLKLELFDLCKKHEIKVIPIDVENPQQDDTAEKLIGQRNIDMTSKAIKAYNGIKKAVIFIGALHFFTTTHRGNKNICFKGVRELLDDQGIKLKSAIFPIEKNLQNLWEKILLGQYDGDHYFAFPVKEELRHAFYMSDAKELPNSAEELFSWRGTLEFSAQGLLTEIQTSSPSNFLIYVPGVSSDSNSKKTNNYDPTFFASSETADESSAILPANISEKEKSKSNDSSPSPI